jgi:acetyl-CoA acetyltransferase
MAREPLAVVAGIAETPVGHVPEMTAQEMLLTSIVDAVADAGLTLADVDGLYTAGTRVDHLTTSSSALAEALDLRPRICLTMPIGGMQFTASVYQAAALIKAGIASTIVCACADNPLSSMQREGTVERFAEDAAHPEFEAPYGAAVFSLYALIAQRQMYQYGTTEEQMSMVSVQLRENASRNPKAQKRDSITVDDVMNSPMISTPFRRLHCSLISDGGGAVVVTSADRVKDMLKEPVYLLGAGESRHHLYISQAHDLTYSSASRSSEIALKEAGISASELDFACFYDSYAMMPIIGLEAIGICGSGEGGDFVEDGNIAPDGALPINPHGGMLSYAHPGRSGGWLNMLEAIRQLRREALGVQLSADVGLVQANAGVESGEITLIFGRG